MIIAVDGHSSTGKSTVAKLLATRLGYVYIDTGAMYRAVTLAAMRNGLINGEYVDEEKLRICLKIWLLISDIMRDMPGMKFI